MAKPVEFSEARAPGILLFSPFTCRTQFLFRGTFWHQVWHVGTQSVSRAELLRDVQCGTTKMPGSWDTGVLEWHAASI